MVERLVELIREGIIPDVIRQKACRGELPVSLPEKVEILVLLAGDKDDETRNCAFQALESWPPEELQQVLSDPATPVEVLEFVAYNLTPSRRELGTAMLRNPSLPSQVHEWIETTAALLAEAEACESSELPLPAVEEDGDSSTTQEATKKLTVLQRIRTMTPVQRIKTALVGSQEERLILVRDSNKLVARAVLQSAKLTDHEVENFASMKDISEEILRRIVLSRKFMKNYAVIRTLVNNPRTPIDVGLTLLHHVNERDLKALILNHNVSDVIRNTADKFIRRKKH
jgi:hypothetical protein